MAGPRVSLKTKWRGLFHIRCMLRCMLWWYVIDLWFTILQWIRPDKHSSPVQWMVASFFHTANNVFRERSNTFALADIRKFFFKGRLKAGGWEDFAVDLLPVSIGLFRRWGWQLWWQRWCLQGPVGDGVGGGMGGGEEAGQQETGPVTVRKLLFRDSSLFAGDEAGSLCRSQLNQGVSTN